MSNLPLSPWGKFCAAINEIFSAGEQIIPATENTENKSENKPKDKPEDKPLNKKEIAIMKDVYG